MQRARRSNPYPLTWEIPLAIACAVLLALALGAHLGRGVANWWAGAGWLWPPPAQLFRSVPAILSGDAHAGLQVAGQLADPGAVVGWVFAVELAIVVLLTIAAVFVLGRWGPDRLRGVASPDEVERLLGVARLRRVRHVVRPGLYAPRRAVSGGRR